MMDQEMLLLLRELEQKGVEFTAMLQKLVLYNICISCCFTGQERLQIIDLQSVCWAQAYLCVGTQIYPTMKWEDFSQTFLMWIFSFWVNQD